MKKIFTLLFSAALVTVASAQSGDRHRNDSRSNTNSYQSSAWSNNDQKGYSNQYSNGNHDSRNSQWNEREDHDRFDHDRKRAEQERFEMMRRRSQPQYRDERRYDNHSSGLVLPLLGLLAVIISSR